MHSFFKFLLKKNIYIDINLQKLENEKRKKNYEKSNERNFTILFTTRKNSNR